jgi:hypothetical protein
MNKSILIFVTIILGIICLNMAWGLSNTMLETPKYELIKKSGSYEIRKYAPMIIARTQVESGYKEASSKGFRRIANYIFGGNDKSVEIAMTAPVITDSPVGANNIYEIAFVMPSAYDREELPKPNSRNVEIVGRKLETVATISFGGWATGEKVKKYQKKLSNWIFKEGLKTTGNFMVAQYNSPWALPPFRHNEIIVRLSQ